MEDQYSMADLSHYMNVRPIFPAIPPPHDILQSHQSLTAAQHYEMVMAGRTGSDHMGHQGLQQEFQSDSTTSATNNSVVIGGTGTSSGGFSGGFDMDGGGLAGDGSTGRWPRQETLTLLEIRSKLDSKFKEANQKGPLWDEISRIMSEEHGYHRSGKKCREKFENLYKYYKKTKEGKAGRQDGKHYRFFRQLEALYGGETTNLASVASEQHHLTGNRFHYNAKNSNVPVPNPEHFQASKSSDSLSLSSSDFDTTTSDESDLNVVMENDLVSQRKKRKKSSWKAKIKEFVDGQMRKLMEKQEVWLEKMMKTIEHKESERMLREEEWRKQEEARIEKEHQFWAKEKAWIEARDTALMEALKKLPGKEFINPSKEKQNAENGTETTTASQEIATKMAALGYEKSPLMCKEKWAGINDFLDKCIKKEKESLSNSSYFEGNDTICGLQVGGYGGTNDEAGGTRSSGLENDDDHNASSLPNCNTAGQNMNDGCFRCLMSDAENLWENLQRR